MLLLICFAEALEDNPSQSLSTRRKRRSCPDVELICPTQKQYFVVRSHWSSRSKSCQLQASTILNAVLTVCDNGVMDQCKDKWINKPNNCTVPFFKILKKILDRVFHHACTLHDLCYLTLGTTQEDCDNWFYHNLKQVCQLKSWLKRAGCRATAYLMYKAVQLVGEKYHSDGQKWAKENCTSEDPSKDPGSANGSGGSGSGSGVGKIVSMDIAQ